ncbi:unnamed protein product [Phytomonas sp. EM1]|nr:unnamed protein product [Phytomonas sp. EM1]|eukprot:CCW60447.1 unnamed protein product [Phytomonas sp. isolate EM1]
MMSVFAPHVEKNPATALSAVFCIPLQKVEDFLSKTHHGGGVGGVIHQHLMQHPRTQLIVVDDFTQLVQRSFSGFSNLGDLIQRQATVHAAVQAIKCLATKSNACVLLLTQCISNLYGRSSTATSLDGSMNSSSGNFGPVLYHAVNLRMHLRRIVGNTRDLIHLLTITKSSFCGAEQLLLRLSGRGVEEVEPDDMYAPNAAAIEEICGEEVLDSIDIWDYVSVPQFLRV